MATVTTSTPVAAPTTPATKGKGKGKAGKGKGKPVAAPSNNGNAAGVARKGVKGKLGKGVLATQGVALRASWQGFSITSVLRYLGVAGCTVAQATAVIAKLGLGNVVKTNTIKNQVQSGRRGAALSHFGPPAALSKAQGASLMAMVPAAS